MGTSVISKSVFLLLFLASGSDKCTPPRQAVWISGPAKTLARCLKWRVDAAATKDQQHPERIILQTSTLDVDPDSPHSVDMTGPLFPGDELVAVARLPHERMQFLGTAEGQISADKMLQVVSGARGGRMVLQVERAMRVTDEEKVRVSRTRLWVVLLTIV